MLSVPLERHQVPQMLSYRLLVQKIQVVHGKYRLHVSGRDIWRELMGKMPDLYVFPARHIQFVCDPDRPVAHFAAPFPLEFRRDKKAQR